MKRKQAKIRQENNADYFIFLPPMNEGFHLGYQQDSGIISGKNKHPGDWMESLSRYLKTDGKNVGYSIPDVLAWEHQLLHVIQYPELACHNQQFIDYRAILAILLLWDCFEEQQNWPLLELKCLTGYNTAFQTAVTNALSTHQAEDGIWVFTLRYRYQNEKEGKPLAMISRRTGIVPAAVLKDTIPLIPARFRWVNPEKNCFEDPCEKLTQMESLILRHRLRILSQLCENSKYQSALYDKEAVLAGLFHRFIADIEKTKQASASLAMESSNEKESLLYRFLCSTDLETGLSITKEKLTLDRYPASENSLIRLFMGKGLPEPAYESYTCYFYQNRAFSIKGDDWLPCRSNDPEEPETLALLSEQMRFLLVNDKEFRENSIQKLTEQIDILQSNEENTLYCDVLDDYIRMLQAIPNPAELHVAVREPLDEQAEAIKSLLSELFGLKQQERWPGVFSDGLTLCTLPPFCDASLNEFCRVQGENRECYFIPPLSEWLCQCLQNQSEKDDTEQTLQLDVSKMKVEYQANAGLYHAELTIIGKNKAGQSRYLHFEKSYPLRNQIEKGAAFFLKKIPYVMLWPNLRFRKNLWKTYYLLMSKEEECSVVLPDREQCTESTVHSRDELKWRMAACSGFPVYIPLQHEQLTLGALLNLAQTKTLRIQSDAVASIDFGSIATTAMLRIGDSVLPATWPESLHGVLLNSEVPESFLQETFFTENALIRDNDITFYSVMDLFSDNPENWKRELLDGHIYYHHSFEELFQKKADTLYYDLKWSDENYIRRCLSLFFKQAMIQISLSARINGAQSITWRISMPSAMPIARQDAYLQMMKELAHEVAEKTGMPLTEGKAGVLFANENTADGIYFLSQGEVSKRGGYLNLDIGGVTTDISLWISGNYEASCESSIMMGVRQMLFQSLAVFHPDELTKEATPQLLPVWQKIISVYRNEGGYGRGLGKTQIMFDEMLAAMPSELIQMMKAARSIGKISYFEALLLYRIGFLFYLCGEMLNEAENTADWKNKIPDNLPLCIAGNGGKLVSLIPEDQRLLLCSLCLHRLEPKHPLHGILPVLSKQPKKEVSIGLLYADEALQSNVSVISSKCERIAQNDRLLEEYLLAFFHIFPHAAQRLIPQVFTSEGQLKETAKIELGIVLQNERDKASGDCFAYYERCFTAINMIWRV